MQSNEIKPIDARRFTEIYSSLSKTESQELNSAIVGKTGCTKMAVSFWGRGIRTPHTLSVKRDIVDCLRKVLGIRTTTITLFP